MYSEVTTPNRERRITSFGLSFAVKPKATLYKFDVSSQFITHLIVAITKSFSISLLHVTLQMIVVIYWFLSFVASSDKQKSKYHSVSSVINLKSELGG